MSVSPDFVKIKHQTILFNYDAIHSLEIKSLANEKESCNGCSICCQSTLTRVHANLKNDDSVPIEFVFAPLEEEVKIHKNELWHEYDKKECLVSN